MSKNKSSKKGEVTPKVAEHETLPVLVRLTRADKLRIAAVLLARQ